MHFIDSYINGHDRRSQSPIVIVKPLGADSCHTEKVGRFFTDIVRFVTVFLSLCATTIYRPEDITIHYLEMSLNNYRFLDDFVTHNDFEGISVKNVLVEKSLFMIGLM